MTRVDHCVQRKLLLALESFQAVTQVRSLWVVRLLVTCQVVLALQRCIANLANEAALHVLMADHVLVENFFFRVGDLTLRANEEHRAVQCELQSDLARLRPWLLLLRRLLLFLLLRGRNVRRLRLDVMNYGLRLLDRLDDVGD